MGRKKRKVEIKEENIALEEPPKEEKEEPNEEEKEEPAASKYAVTSHSGEIIQEDIYISDGSEDDEEDDFNILLAGSRTGIMRRGLHQPLVQPNRQWSRQQQATTSTTDEQQQESQEEILAKLDPAERAARLLQEKQRKAEEEKIAERQKESAENAGRDPLLFSKRTAFDIRFDHIEDKPWLRGDMSDFFNYGLNEDDWLQYAEHQLLIRQELIDARKQKRPADPTIVPVAPLAAGVSISKENDVATGEAGTAEEVGEALGPAAKPEKDAAGEGTKSGEGTERTSNVKKEEESREDLLRKYDIPDAGAGGAWGGAPPGSKLAQLIEEQERGEQQNSREDDGRSSGVKQDDDDHYRNEDAPHGYYGDRGPPPPPFYGAPPPPPPGDGPPQPPHAYGRGRGFDRYGGRGGRGRGPPPGRGPPYGPPGGYYGAPGGRGGPPPPRDYYGGGRKRPRGDRR